MRKVIVAIGGGDIRTKGTARIDREIIRLSNKKHPRLLFVPTASSDSGRYWQHVQEYFGKFLRCRTDALFLLTERPSTAQIRRKILGADVIYVGGGNTLQMMCTWRRHGIDDLLRSAYENGPFSLASAPVRFVGLTRETLTRCRSMTRESGIT